MASPQRDSALSRAFKEATSGFIAVAALVYALGWYLRVQAEATLNVGPIEVNHQAAVAAGFAFLLLYSPLWVYLGWTRKFDAKSTERLLIPALVGLGVVVVLALYGFTRPVRLLDAFFLFILVNFGNVALRLIIRDIGLINAGATRDSGLLTIFWFGIFLGQLLLFGSKILPYMHPSLGGFYDSRATLELDSGVVTGATVVDSDSDSVVIRVGPLPPGTWITPYLNGPIVSLPYRRIYKREIKSIQFDQNQPGPVPNFLSPSTGLTGRS